MRSSSHSHAPAASRRLRRALSYLQQAGRQLAAASRAATSHHQQEQLLRSRTDLAKLCSPLAGLAISLARGGER
jgi:hypothetical protein